MSDFRKKFGIVILMDALGARGFSEEKIEWFLRARSKIQESFKNQVKLAAEASVVLNPATYTFGDTLVITIELDKEDVDIGTKIYATFLLLQNMLYLYMSAEILFRGAFSFGEYISDEDNNSVMGSAVTDAAAWYEKSEWFGVAATPSATNFLDYNFKKHNINRLIEYIVKYPVPLKNSEPLEMYCLAWPSSFFREDKENPEIDYLRIISSMIIPSGAERKYVNSEKFFDYVIKLCKGEKTS